MGLLPGQRVGDYEILNSLGAGGMGSVYRVRNTISDRIEAMKVLLPNLEDDPALADRFLREIKVQASLNHPNIAQLYTAVRADNQLLMLMEYVEGYTLEQLMNQGRLPLPQGLDCICQVLSALAFAHSRGVVHRDIKPANMMITPQGVVKLMDFGIARATADRRLTQTGQTVGSLYYMSPEQIRGGELDSRADLYSLGITLYEVVTGRRPFQGDSDFSIMAAHLQQAPAPPIQLDPSLPAALNDIILLSISKDPGERFQSADALRNALASVLAELGRSPQMRPGASAPVPPPPGAFHDSPTATAPRPAAAGAFGSTGMPPQPAATPLAPPAPQAPPPAPAPPPASSRRGLYMALGSLATVAVLVVAFTQLPKWLRTSASSSTTATPLVSTPPPAQTTSQPQVLPQQQQQAQPAALTEPPPPQQQSLQPTAQQPRQTATVPHRPAPQVPATRPPAAAGQSSSVQPPAQQQQVQPPVATPPVAAAPNASAHSTATEAPQTNQAELRALRERMMLMATRVGPIRDTLQRIETEQARQGLGMNPEIKAAHRRFVYFMDQAETALKDGDAATAKASLDRADNILERVERFVGVR
jgi:eukaryotic-like serine/threonine-protein kinase